MWATEEGWQEISSNPPQGPQGGTTERLFVRLVYQEGRDGARWFNCSSWLAAARDATLVARGPVTIRLLHGDQEIAFGRTDVDVRLDPGTRSSERSLPRFVDLPPDGEAVTCEVFYQPPS